MDVSTKNIKKIKLKNNNIMTILYNCGEVSDNDDFPAITLHNPKGKLIGFLHVSDGLIGNLNGRSVYFNDDILKYDIYSQFGKIHRRNLPAINFSESDLGVYEYHFKSGLIDNVNGSAVLKYNKDSAIHIFARNNETLNGFNCKIYRNNILKTKANICVNFETTLSLSINDYRIESIFDTLTLYLKSLNSQTEMYEYHVSENDEIPNVIEFSSPNKLKSLFWINQMGLHREKKPALVTYEKNKVHFYYYENGTKTETLLIPHFFVKSRNSKMNIHKFNFLNKDLQQHYEKENLTPFYLNMKNINEIKESFSS